MSEPKTDVVIRRRGALMAVIAAGSACFAAGYLWRFGATQSAASLAIGVVLGIIAVCFGYAWTDAQAPLLVADPRGLRIRLGSAWTGVAWELVDSIEVELRGRVRDGQITVVSPASAELLRGASRRSRWAAWLNRWLYDAPLVVPFGLTTRVSVPDVAGALDGLAAGRAAVVVVNGPDPEPEITVDVSPTRQPAEPEPARPGAAPEPAWAAASAEPAWRAAAAESGRATESVVNEPVAGSAVTAAVDAPEPEMPALLALDEGTAGEDPAAELTVPSEVIEIAEPPHGEPPRPKPRRKLWTSREPGRTSARRSAVSAYRATPARREEITIAARADDATAGALALSDPEVAVTTPLPEISHLRRPTEDSVAATDQDPPAAGNVSLIIDATTDLTTRAMQRVRTPWTGQVPDGDGSEPVRSELDVPMPGTAIGGQLTQARVNLELTVDELAERTRIRPYVIESIEVDDFSPCGGDFYARGHLRMLSRMLGIDATPLIAAYDERFASTPVNARRVFEVELATGSTGVIRGSRSGANWGALIAAVLVLLLVWGVARFVTVATGAAASHASDSNHPVGVGSPGAGNPPAHQGPAQAQVKLTASGGDSRVVVKDRRGHVLFSGALLDGTAKKFHGQAPLRVHAADAGVVTLSVKGVPLGPVGDAGVPGHRLVRPPADHPAHHRTNPPASQPH